MNAASPNNEMQALGEKTRFSGEKTPCLKEETAVRDLGNGADNFDAL